MGRKGTSPLTNAPAARRLVAGLWRLAPAALSAVVALCVTAGPLSPSAWAQTQNQTATTTAAGNGLNFAPASRNAPSSFPTTPGGPLGNIQKIDKSQPLYLQGDELIYDTRNNRVIAKGSVEIYYNNYVLTADEVVYDQTANTLTAKGNAQIKEPNGNIVRGDEIVATADFRDAFIESLSAIGRDDTRIAARRAVRKDGNVTEFEQGKFTPCKNDPGKPPLWCVSAARVIHDQQAGTLTYQDAQFELFGMPVFYLPYFQHGDPSTKRRSGFLMPEYSTSTDLGFGVAIPYFFALSPYYDFTFTPKYWSKQGPLYQGEWRHRVAFGDINGEYNVKLAGIEQDGSNLPSGTPQSTRDKLDGWRGSIQSQGRFSLSSWWRFGWDATIESDDAFRRFYKLDSILQTDRINTAWLQGLSERNHFSMQLYQFGGLVLENSLASQSRVMPVIDWNYIVNQPVLGGELSFNGNAQSVTRTTGTNMNRLSLEADWRRKIVDPIGQVWQPFAYARADVTQFDHAFDPNTGTPVADDTISRSIGAVGLKYSYPFIAHSDFGSHVVEPIGQIVARPDSVSRQRLIPVEDAKSLVWDDTTLFDVDKFSGWDRIETGTRANVGLQYTFQGNGGAYARIVGGQSYQLTGTNPFADPGQTQYSYFDSAGVFHTTNVANFSPNSGLQTSSSDYVLAAYLQPFSNFKVVAQSRFDESDLALKRQSVYAHTNYGPLSLDAQYSYTRDDPAIGLLQSQQEILAGVGLKLTDRWSVHALARYDIDQSLVLQDQIQLKYSDECFVLTASYTETRITNPTLGINPDQTIMLRFELKHLGQYNYNQSHVDHIFAENQAPVK